MNTSPESGGNENPVILIIEDELPIRRFLKPYLHAEGFSVLESDTGKEGLNSAGSANPAVILLDLGLPDMDGFEVLQALRQNSDVPVIILTARGKEEDKIRGLDAGADDYLTKPFNVGELLARIRTALRHRPKTGTPGPEMQFSAGDLNVDLAKRIVLVRGREVHLTPNEFNILSLLISSAGRVVTQKKILREVWGHAGQEQEHYVRLFIHQLRGKIESDPARPTHIITEPGVGYRLRDE